MSIVRKNGMTDGEYLGYLCFMYESASLLERREIEEIIAEMAESTNSRQEELVN